MEKAFPLEGPKICEKAGFLRRTETEETPTSRHKQHVNAECQRVTRFGAFLRLYTFGGGFFWDFPPQITPSGCFIIGRIPNHIVG